MDALKAEECRTKFCQHMSIHVPCRTRKKLCDADSFTKRIQDAARETLSGVGGQELAESLCFIKAVWWQEDAGPLLHLADVSPSPLFSPITSCL
ncbi:hypothetical protein RB195_022971 [Necator americanus]|uniref:Uncharacterized protein n=1 Tax=Necator americanus TaxID=51031 RepID=A0ABR1EJU9_NECAM